MAQLTSDSRSPNSSEASSATDSGWESMMTLPSPADVRCSPSARKPCSWGDGSCHFLLFLTRVAGRSGCFCERTLRC